MLEEPPLLVRSTPATAAKRVWNDGSQPGTRTFLYLRPTQGIIIALMTNMEGAACEELVPQILEAIGQRQGTPRG